MRGKIDVPKFARGMCGLKGGVNLGHVKAHEILRKIFKFSLMTIKMSIRVRKLIKITFNFTIHH